MTKHFTEREANAYSRLLDYFAHTAVANPKPIYHPGRSLNEFTVGQEGSLRRAAVLIPITRFQPNLESHIVLTVRSENLRNHAGQISLPGGSQAEHDSDEIATALRESEEEIGLAPHQVEIIGRLGEMALPSGFRVTPIVGIIDSGLDLKPCPHEVADIFHAPLNLVLDPSAYRHTEVMFNAKPRKILELIYEDYRIWGATAAILYHLAKEVAGDRN